MKNGCNLEVKVEINPNEHIDSFSKFLDKGEVAKDPVEKSKEGEDTKKIEKIEMDTDEKCVKDVTLLREEGVLEILSRYSALIVQKRPKEEKRILVESESGKARRILVESESGKTKRILVESGKARRSPMKILPQSKHKSQQPAITVDQVSTTYNLDSSVFQCSSLKIRITIIFSSSFSNR